MLILWVRWIVNTVLEFQILGVEAKPVISCLNVCSLPVFTALKIASSIVIGLFFSLKRKCLVSVGINKEFIG
jgi:hypothetical protein